jgi:PAS domain-containing protein
MVTSISTERVSELIGVVYDCVTQPDLWEHALGEIRRDLGFLAGVLGVYDVRAGTPLLQYHSGMQLDWLERMKSYGPDMMAYWGGRRRVEAYSLDEPVSHAIGAKDIDVAANRFHREWLRPQGIADLVAIRVTIDGPQTGTLVFTRHDSAGVAGETELAALRLISPHVRRAVTISGLFDHKAVVAESFSAALDALTLGIVLVDDQARVVHANRAASDMLDARDPIILTNAT